MTFYETSGLRGDIEPRGNIWMRYRIRGCILLWRLSTFSMCISLSLFLSLSLGGYRFLYLIAFFMLSLSLFPCHFWVLGICSPWAYASPCVGRVLMPRGFWHYRYLSLGWCMWWWWSFRGPERCLGVDMACFRHCTSILVALACACIWPLILLSPPLLRFEWAMPTTLRGS